MKIYLRQNNSKNLIVFFCGWALDEKPFKPLESSSYDVLFVYDYSNLLLDFDFSQYEKKILVAFSYGVFIASLIKDKLPEFTDKIAINGTLKPIDKELGISEKIFDLTFNSISEESMKKFYSRMFDNNLDDEYFAKNLPTRKAIECKDELSKIKGYYLESKDTTFDFDKIIVSNSDKIFSPKSQLNYWQSKEIKQVDAGHFLFYKFKNFDEIINL